MAERFRGRTQLGVQSFDTGASSELLTLSRKFQQFGQDRVNKLNRQREEEAFEAGRGALVEGEAPKFKEERFFGGVPAKAFNQGLRNSYLASVANDNRESFNVIEQQNATDVAAYNNAAAAHMEGVLTEVDPTVALDVKQLMENRASQGRIRVQDAQFKQQAKQARIEADKAWSGFADDAARYARNGDTQSAKDALATSITVTNGQIESGQISREAGEARIREVKREVNEQELKRTIENVVEDQGLDAAFDQVSEAAKNVPEGWTPDEWDSFIAGEQANLNRQANQLKNDIKANAEQLSLDASIARGMLFQDPGIPADPAKNSQDRKDVNNAYAVESPKWSTLPIQEQIERNVSFIKNTGIVPDEVISNVNAASRSGTPEQVGLITNLIGRLEELPNAANVLRDLPDESRAFSIQVADSVRSGISIEEATEIARKNTYGLTEQQKEVIKINTQEVAKQLPDFLADQVDEAFDPSAIPFFGEEPDVPVDMQADYNVAFGKFMTLTDGNTEQAKQLAFGSIRKIWAPTNIGGEERFMRSAPEAFYAVDGFDNDWMDNQFNVDMEEAGAVGAMLSTDFTTGRSQTPSYPILITNEQGFTDILRDDATGEPMRWKPDFKTTPEFAEVSEAPGKEIESAKKRRERQLSLKASNIRRGIQQNLFQNIPRADREEFAKTEEGIARIRRSVNNMIATDKIDAVEAKGALEAFGAGDVDSLPVMQIRGQ